MSFQIIEIKILIVDRKDKYQEWCNLTMSFEPKTGLL